MPEDELILSVSVMVLNATSMGNRAKEKQIWSFVWAIRKLGFLLLGLNEDDDGT